MSSRDGAASRPHDNRTTHDTLKRLLGPADPEVLCDECFERLDEYVDLQLEGTNADDKIPGMRAHLEGCPACQEEYDSLRELVHGGDSIS